MFFFCGLGYCLCKEIRVKRRYSSSFCWTIWAWDFGHCVKICTGLRAFPGIFLQPVSPSLESSSISLFCRQNMHLLVSKINCSLWELFFFTPALLSRTKVPVFQSEQSFSTIYDNYVIVALIFINWRVENLTVLFHQGVMNVCHKAITHSR